MTRYARPITVLCGIALAGGILAGECVPAKASVGSLLGQSITSATATWEATLADADQAAAGGPLLVSWVVVKGRQYGFVDVVNSGTLDLSGMTLSLNTIASDKVPTMEISACTVSWKQSDANCSGVQTSIWSTSGGSKDVSVSLNVGTRLRLLITSGERTSNKLTTTLGAKVSRNQARSATTVNQ